MTKEERKVYQREYGKRYHADPVNKAKKREREQKLRENPEYVAGRRVYHRAWRAEKEYGLTLSEYEALTTTCSVCGESEKRVCVDHCHATGQIRGGLCVKCNTALGLMNDDPELLRKAAAYIEHHRRLRT